MSSNNQHWNNKTPINTQKTKEKLSKKDLEKIAKLDKSTNQPLKVQKTVDHVLTSDDLIQWVINPKSMINKSRTDKIKEVIILMANLGLRVSEAIDFDWSKGKIGLSNWQWKIISKSVVGKGKNKKKKPRAVFNVFDNEYINNKAQAYHDKLLTPDKVKDFPVTRQGVYDYLVRHGQRLNWHWKKDDDITTQHVTPHDFRRSFATRLLYEHDISYSELKDLLGHESIVTTERYVRKDSRNLESSLIKRKILKDKKLA